MTSGNNRQSIVAPVSVVWGAVLALLIVLAGCSAEEPGAGSETVTDPVAPAGPLSRASFSLDDVATPTPTPRPTATPTATPSPTPIPIPLQETLAAEAYAFLRSFLEDHTRREAGTADERSAARAIRSTLDDLGYETRVESFDVGPADSHVSYVVQGDSESVQVDVPSRALDLSPHGEVTGEPVYVEQALEGEVPAGGLDGKVALIERGVDLFSDKVKRAAAAGAEAAIIFNNVSGEIDGILTEGSPIPTVGITREQGLRLLNLLDTSPPVATVRVSPAESNSLNVIAEKPGTQADGGIVYVGTYVDTGASVDGANDNGSGIASLVTVARHIANREYPFTVRLAVFGSLHDSTSGSRYHLGQLDSEELSSIKVMVNLFMIGSGEALHLKGASEYTAIMMDVGEELGVDIRDQTYISATDAASFDAREIDTVTLTGNDYTHHHMITDTIENIDATLLGQGAEVTFAFLETLAGR